MVQSFLVVQLDPEDQTWLMVASVVGCMVSIVYLAVTLEIDADTSPHSRANYMGYWHGFIPTKSAVRQALTVSGLVLFLSGILGAKLIALVILAGASIPLGCAWCSGELFALTLARGFAEGTWRFHQRGFSGLMGSSIYALAFYICMLATPFPLMRYSNFTTRPRRSAALVVPSLPNNIH